jgi:methionyl aminopeptidase
MKIDIKKPHELEAMQEGGKKLSQILKQLISFTQVGMTLAEIDAEADRLIAHAGGSAGFKTVDDYRWATCINVNDGVVHGIPNAYTLVEGDVISIDIGMLYHGLHTDMSYTFLVGKDKLDSNRVKEVEHFLQAGKTSLNKAIGVIKPGRRVGHISEAMGGVIQEQGFACVDNLTGHGIGKQLHMYPPVPCLVLQPITTTPVLKEGMTLAVEVIYTQGEAKTYTDTADNWTIRTQDGKLAAVFEKTIAITRDGFLLITP